MSGRLNRSMLLRTESPRNSARGPVSRGDMLPGVWPGEWMIRNPAMHGNHVAMLHGLMHRGVREPPRLPGRPGPSTAPGNSLRPTVPGGRRFTLVALSKQQGTVRAGLGLVLVGHNLRARQLMEFGGAPGVVEVEMGHDDPSEVAGASPNLPDVGYYGLSISGDAGVHHGHTLVRQQDHVAAGDVLQAMDPRGYFHDGAFLPPG